MTTLHQIWDMVLNGALFYELWFVFISLTLVLCIIIIHLLCIKFMDLVSEIKAFELYFRTINVFTNWKFILVKSPKFICTNVFIRTLYDCFVFLRVFIRFHNFLLFRVRNNTSSFFVISRYLWVYGRSTSTPICLFN